MRDQLYSETNQYLSKRLRQARLDAGMKQTQLAQKTDRSQSYISAFERGQIRLDVGDFILLTKVLKIDIHGLLDELIEMS